MYYHASSVKNIKTLEPRVSNHNVARIYLSEKRENVLVYLSNAVEKFCKENNFKYEGIWSKWASYGFTKDGILEIQEYYPNATYETYHNVSGYIYSINDRSDIIKQEDIPFAYHTDNEIDTVSAEYVEDAYLEIEKQIKLGHLAILKYEDFIKDEKKLEWLYKTMQKEYDKSIDHPEYRYFIENKFPFVKH